MLLNVKKLLSYQLKQQLPGKEVQYQMASKHRINDIPTSDAITSYKESAVCILLYQKENLIYFPLIERAVYKGVHSGQLALPGGKKDLSDISIEHTALRELEEEIGVSGQHIEVIGKLSTVYIPPSNFLVHPFVAVSSEVPVFKADLTEVQKIIPFTLQELLNEDLVKQTRIELENGYMFNTPYFDVKGNVLWGATAMILNELKYILKSNPSSFLFQ